VIFSRGWSVEVVLVRGCGGCLDLEYVFWMNNQLAKMQSGFSNGCRAWFGVPDSWCFIAGRDSRGCIIPQCRN
jgi:hypothetical protein